MFLPFSQRVSQGSTNLNPLLVYINNQAANVKLAAFFMLLRKQCVKNGFSWRFWLK